MKTKAPMVKTEGCFFIRGAVCTGLDIEGRLQGEDCGLLATLVIIPILLGHAEKSL